MNCFYKKNDYIALVPDTYDISKESSDHLKIKIS